MYRYRFFFKITRICAMLFAGLAVAGFIALSQVKLETLRGDLISVMQNATGLPVEIDGEISWKFSLRPRVVLNQVKIPNADWAEHKNGFYADRITATLDLLSLMRGKTEISSLKIYDVDVFLEKNESGQDSIEFAKSEIIKPTSDAQEKFPFDFNIGLDSLEIYNARAIIGNSEHYVSGLRIEYNNLNDTQKYSGWLRGDSKVYPFIVSFSKFNPERKIYPAQVALSTGGNALVVNIALEGTSKIPIDFKVSGSISDIADLGQVFGRDFPKMPEIEVNMAGGFAKQKLNLRKSSISARGSTVNLSGSFDWSDEIPNIVAKIDAKKIDLMAVFPELYGSGQKWVHPDRPLNIFQDIPLFGSEFHKYNFNLTLIAQELVIYRDLAINHLDAKIVLNNSKMRIDAKTNIADGDVNAAAILDADAQGDLKITIAGTGDKVYVGEILKSVRESDYISQLPVNFGFYFQGHGADLSNIMGSLTGPLELYSVGTGFAHSELVSYMYGGDFLTDLRHNVTSLFRSRKKNEQLNISCVAINLKLRDGKISTDKGIAAETNAINLRLVGDLNFETENMKISMITVPVRGLKLSISGNVVNNIEFVGNIAEPNLSINGDAVIAKAASATGIGLLLAPFTGGLSIVAGAGVGLLAGDLLENWLADDHPCETAMKNGAPLENDDADFMNQSLSELIGTMIK